MMLPDLQKELEDVARIQAQPVQPKLCVGREGKAVDRCGHVQTVEEAVSKSLKVGALRQ